MRFSPISFLLGLAAASALPVLSRAFRPLAVEAMALGMGVVDDVRRLVAEQMESLEDIAAEARARREELAAEAELEPEGEAAPVEETADRPAQESPATGRARRRRAASQGADGPPQ
jgi:hypothetical protein